MDSSKPEGSTGSWAAGVMDNDDLANFIDGMKAREADERKLSDEHQIRATLIQGERMKLEAWIYKVRQRDEAHDKQIASLLS